ncbi:dihydrofolate reductase family protein [Roseivivax marinus]|uniref:RibD family protein n=1 Tax=Roseivivax marinus TaxID=1379903 RepID=UPI001F0343B6|nr:dihydrofolate reductase family protein [Roseivivax marinus]UMA66615.1 dihydrofolate reductase family protein [Roseivivax marinus]
MTPPRRGAGGGARDARAPRRVCWGRHRPGRRPEPYRARLGRRPAAVRVVAARLLDLPSDGQLARTAGDVPVWLCHGPDAPGPARAGWTGRGARLLECPLAGRQLDPRAVMAALGAAGLTRVFCEGGGMLAASLLSAGLVDEVIGFTAGLALGAEGHPSLGPLGVDRLDEAPRFALVETRAAGRDVMHRWRKA